MTLATPTPLSPLMPLRLAALCARLLRVVLPPVEPIGEAERRSHVRETIFRNPTAFQSDLDVQLWMSQYPGDF